MTTGESPGIQDLVADLLTQQWVTDLFTELSERQQESLAVSGQVRAKSVSSHAFWPFHAPQFPLVTEEASGSRITDVDGRTYLDSHLGFGAQALFGHNPPRVVEAVRDLLGRSTGNGYLHPVEQRLATLLGEFVPHCERFAFLNSGTDATAAAIRLTRAHTGRRMVAKFEGSLHGVHDIAAHNTAFWYHGHPVEPFPEIGEHGVTPLPALTGVAPAPATELLILPNDTEAALALIERHREELACVLGEAVSSSYPYAEHTVPLIRQVAERCGELRVPFVLDEVLTGFRYGPSGAAGHFDIPADLYCYGKVVTGLGLPLSVLGGRSDLLEHMTTSGLALTDLGRKTCVQTTHAGNHLSLAASYASLSLLREQGDAYYTRTRAKVELIRTRLAGFRAETGIPLRLLGFGDFIGSFGFTAEESYADYRTFAEAVNPIGLFLLTLMLRRRGVYTLSLPMLFTGDVHSEADIDEISGAVIDSARELAKHDFPFVLP
ncbi:aminotransferase class III-fold pyridoxal phosphate-dependent enzyme [Streptomyces iconiensis]|uniref:Aminotransferase class III-fold pyridoxal phosphate-dependent enzyme n=1 Tax=Streptomyces iconiensis TaxID=1384038 RepID=A0ABT6ZY42_9ACTN|nr:aminotransferase class III-fold pyridoxal phosphate-dependent enzyme [Streptomyces iconiensis]MDJ1133987.1 aminotransferase class III-fold pyridoxal phosphate-dependent enzyme [Streptomyces iconiensis]